MEDLSRRNEELDNKLDLDLENLEKIEMDELIIEENKTKSKLTFNLNVNLKKLDYNARLD